MADGSINFDTKVDTSGFKDQIRQIENDIKSLNKELDAIEKERQVKLKFIQDNENAYNVDKFLLKKNTPLVQEYDAAFDRVIAIEDREGQINTLIDEKNRLLDETKAKLQRVNAENQSFVRTSENSKIISKDLIRQFTSLGTILKSRLKTALIRGLFSGIPNGFSSLLKYYPNLQESFNNMNNSLAQLGGNFVAAFEPIISFILPVLTKLIDYINIAVTAIAKFFAVLTGRNYITKATKGMSGYAGAVQKANKQLAGFDELNNLSEDTGSGGGGSGSGLNFEKLEMEADEIARIKDLISDLLPLALGLATALTAIKLGLDPLTSLGLGVMIAGIVALVQDLIAYIQDPSWENLLKILMDIGVIIAGLAIAFGAVTGGWAIALAALAALVLLFKDDIAKWLVEIGTKLKEWATEKIQAVKDWWANFKEICSTLGTELITRVKEDWSHFGEDLKILWKNVKEGLKFLWEQLKSEVIKSATDIKNGVSEKFNALKTAVVTAWEGIKSGISSVWNSIASTVRSKANSVIGYVENMVNRIIDGINSMTSGLRGLGNRVTEMLGFGSVFGSISHVTLPRLATGTNYVPQNMIAELHKGEAVVPKAFNESQFNNSSETNDLLRTLIDLIERKDFKAVISEKDVGNAAIKQIRSQSRMLGGSVV